ncbi:MAG TPA: hypothetical protein ENI95_12190 [Chloroflexi bacterium]|nr:hypothetical protein [Chloroflexota bacterium]
MRRRMLSILLLAALLSLITLIRPRPARALQAWFTKGASDCASIAASITLVYQTDDSTTGEHRDNFRLEIYDGTLGHIMASVNESITQEQSPFYWVTHRIEAASYNGLYRIEVWDTDGNGDRVRLVEQAYYQCNTGNSWRTLNPIDENPNIPEVTCYARVPLYTTNTAPEPGVIIMMWTYSEERPAPEYHLATRPVQPGDSLDNIELRAPCGTYLRLYYMPDSTRLLYSMPSQYYPHSLYGVPTSPPGGPEVLAPAYYPFFPFDGLPRNVTPSPTPEATATPEPTATP